MPNFDCWGCKRPIACTFDTASWHTKLCGVCRGDPIPKEEPNASRQGQDDHGKGPVRDQALRDLAGALRVARGLTSPSDQHRKTLKMVLGLVQIGTGGFIWWAYDWKASLSAGLFLSCINLRLMYREVFE